MFVALFSLGAYGATKRALYGALGLCVIAYLQSTPVLGWMVP